MTRRWDRRSIESARKRLREAGRHTQCMRDLTYQFQISCVSWASPDINAKIHNATNHSVVKVTSVEHFVNSVIEKAMPFGPKSIKRIKIFGHGSPGVQEVGGSSCHGEIKLDSSSQFVGWKNGKRIPNFHGSRERLLRRIRPHLRHDAVIELRGCKVGRGKSGTALLRKLYHVWGVRVEASTRDQVGLIPGWEGVVRSYGPAGLKARNEKGFLEYIATTINNQFDNCSRNK